MDAPDERPATEGAKPVSRAKPRVDKEARRASYLRAAARAFLNRGAPASMQDVADAAGAPKPVFYRVFPSRAELIEALFAHVHDTIVKTQHGKWDGYGWALRVLYLEAKRDPEIFIVVLKTFRGDPALASLRERLLDLVYKQATKFFTPSDGAPTGPPDRTARASASGRMNYFVACAFARGFWLTPPRLQRRRRPVMGSSGVEWAKSRPNQTGGGDHTPSPLFLEGRLPARRSALQPSFHLRCRPSRPPIRSRPHTGEVDQPPMFDPAPFTRP